MSAVKETWVPFLALHKRGVVLHTQKTSTGDWGKWREKKRRQEDQKFKVVLGQRIISILSLKKR